MNFNTYPININFNICPINMNFADAKASAEELTENINNPYFLL